MTLLYTILAFGVMIFIHELGHFLTARKLGVGIEKFSIGFGKPIKEWKRGGVLWRIGWIPLGGYVKMRGENPDAPDKDAADSFFRLAWWKKALIGFSGPFANLLLGLLLFIISFVLPVHVQDQYPVVSKATGAWENVFAPGDSIVSVNGKPVQGFSEFLENLMEKPVNSVLISRAGELKPVQIEAKDVYAPADTLLPIADTRVGEVVPKTPAYHAKLQPGDRITEVDSVKVTDWYAMRELIINSNRDKVFLTLERDGRSFQKSLKLESSLNTGSNRAIGIMQYQPVRYDIRFNIWEAVRLGAYNTASFINLNYQMLGKLIRSPGELRKSVGGPVMIATMSQQVGQRGFGSLILFFGSISLVLMIMNLLPIPILDGGMILFSIIEGIIRRPIPLKVQSILQSIGFVFLMGLMILAFYSDISSEILRFMNR